MGNNRRHGLAASLASARLRRTAIAYGLGHAFIGLSAFCVAPVAQAQEARTYRIQAGPLTAALNRFGREAGVLLSFSSSMTEGLSSQGLAGNYTVPDGLRVLLLDTGLEARREANGGYTLRALPRSQPGVATLQTVHATGLAERENPVGPVNGYIAQRSSTATKTDTSILEVPQSISVVGRQQIEDQKALTIQDALGYSAGVMTGISAKSPLFDDTLSIRGFEANPQLGSYYRDGLRYMVNLYNGKQELYGLERIEVLKGPSSILYGSAAPGGIVNTVTKRPPREALHELNAEYGSHDRKQLSGDFGGPLDANGEWSYRLTGLARESDTYLDYGRDNRLYIAPALTWRPSAATSLTMLASYQRSSSLYPPAVPATGSLLFNPNGQLDRSTFLGEPNNNVFQTHTTTVGYLFDHEFSDSLKVHHALRYYKSDLTMRYTLLTSDVDALTKRLVSRSARGYDDDTSIITTDTNVEKKFATGAVSHTVLAGVDFTKSEYDSDRLTGRLGAIDIYAPVYQTGPVAVAVNRQIRNRERKLGAYVQDQLKFDDRWTVLLGGRYDRVESVTRSLLPTETKTDDKDSAFTGRAGVVYRADNGLAPYVSFSQSFEPTTGSNTSGARFKPTEGEQYEAGLRYQPPGSSTLISAAVFNLKRTNVLTPDPLDRSQSIQTGEVRSRGLEVEAKTRVGRAVDLIAAYTYTDASVTQSNVANEVGERFNSPRHLFSLWADARLSVFGLTGWRVGAGMRYVSSRPDRPSSQVVAGGPMTLGGPGYVLLDARLGYENGPWTYALNVTNLADKTYVPSMCYGNLCDYGAPRMIIGTATYRW